MKSKTFPRLIIGLLLIIGIFVLTVKTETFYASGVTYKTVRDDVIGLRKNGELQTFVFAYSLPGSRWYIGPVLNYGSYVKTLRLRFVWRMSDIVFYELEFAR